MGEERSYERYFRALHVGDITFDEFAKATMPLWRRMAAQVHARWRVPTWHSQEETVQNFLLGAWMFVWQWDERVGKSCQRYVTWNAYDKAKKLAHRARRARLSGNPDRAPSHIERPLSSYGDDGDDGGDQAHAVERLMHEGGAFTPPDQEQRLIDAEERASGVQRAWGYSGSFAEARAMEVLATAGSLEEAALRIWSDEGVRAELKLKGRGDAERVVTRAARAVAERLTRAA